MLTPPTVGSDVEATGSVVASSCGSLSYAVVVATEEVAAETAASAAAATSVSEAPSKRRREIFDPHSKFKQIRP